MNFPSSGSLEMAKKREHKVFITKEAIRKVPFLHYQEIPEDEFTIIHHLTRQTLQLSMEKNNSNEVSITYSFDSGKILAREDVVGIQFGDEHSVNPLADTLTYHLIMSSPKCTVVSMHNHPSLSLISVTDIRFFLQYESICLLIVVTNLGNISYMAKSKRFDYAKAIGLLNETIQLCKKSSDLKGYQKATKYFINNCCKVGITYKNR